MRLDREEDDCGEAGPLAACHLITRYGDAGKISTSNMSVYAVTFFCIFSSGAIAASVAGGSETFREGVLKSYAYTLVFDVLIFPASPYLVIGVASGEAGPASSP